MKVFWSWQSDTPGKIGRHFVRDALQAAIEQLKDISDIEEPTERKERAAIHLDQDRKGVPGSPDLARIILEKIERSAVFVADVTPVGIVNSNQAADVDAAVQPKKLMNPNVAIELGYALRAHSDSALLMVMNEHYGSRDDLPFDLKAKAGPIMFKLAPDAGTQQIAAASKQLTAEFFKALELCLAENIEAVRQSTPFPSAESKDGPARFRASGEPIGQVWEMSSFGHSLGNSVTLPSGPAIWLRLMPDFYPGKAWSAEELRKAQRSVYIEPFIAGRLYVTRSYDGISFCNIVNEDTTETNSVVFIFETGEIWSVDAWCLNEDRSVIFAGELERGWLTLFENYVLYLRHLGLQPPYRWIAGIVGVKNRRLLYPSPRHPAYEGPLCLVDEITEEGVYDGIQPIKIVLLPFFQKIYLKCGLRRPD